MVESVKKETAASKAKDLVPRLMAAQDGIMTCLRHNVHEPMVDAMTLCRMMRRNWEALSPEQIAKIIAEIEQHIQLARELHDLFESTVMKRAREIHRDMEERNEKIKAILDQPEKHASDKAR